MKNYEKTKAQLVHELTELRTRCSTLEMSARELKQLETEIQDAREYAENIVETVREPLVVLNSALKILTANHSFYDTFKVTPEETIGNFIYDLGNRQWDIPKLRVLFEEILPHETVFNGYEVEHDFQGIGRKIILLNAREIFRENIGSHIILLAMEDITERKQLGEDLQNAHDKLEVIVHERTSALIKANVQLTQEIEERKKAEDELRSYARRLIEMEEDLRKKLAAELHDEIGRDLTVLGMNRVIISGCMTDDAPKKLLERIEDSGKLIEAISRTVRGIMADLRPPVLDDYGLLAAIRWHADLFTERTGIAVLVEADGPFPRLMLEKETSLFRILQEALMNAAKHADTQFVTIKLRRTDGMIRFAVVDEGNGFMPAPSPLMQKGSGWGMKIMRERAELIGGHFHVNSAPGKGTVVSVYLPLEDS